MTLAGFEFKDGTPDEPYHVTFTHALEAALEEAHSWPIVRVLVPATGEIFEGGLFQVLPPIAHALIDRRSVRIEPKDS